MDIQDVSYVEDSTSGIQFLAATIAQKRTLKKMKSQYQPIDLLGVNGRKAWADHVEIHKNFKKSEKKTDKELGVGFDSLDVSDMLKTVSHQKKILTPKLREELYKIHQNSSLTENQDDYKYFMIAASQTNYRKLEHPGYYQLLLSEVPKYPELFFSCIDKDIPRTMPDDHPLQKGLKNVLYTYAIRNPSLLYCQGMNYIVGFLLINKFSEEEAFWFMVQLIEDIVMPDYFKDLSTISITVQVFEDVINETFPDLACEMHEVGMESGIFLVTWFICLFTKGFINSVSQYLLQEVVLESYRYPIGYILLKISISLLATLFTRDQRFEFQEKDFRSLKESIEGSVYEISLEELKKGMEYFDFNFESYEKLKEIYTRRREKTYAKALEQELHEKKLSLPPCDIEKPVCIHRVEIEKKIGTLEEVLILKNNIPINEQYIEDYFPYKANKRQPNLNYESAAECPITHHIHICQATKGLMMQKGFKEQSSKYLPVFECESSEEFTSSFSKIEDKFSEFSAYFIVDENSNKVKQEEQESALETSIEDVIHEGGNGDPRKEEEKKFDFVASIGNVLKKAFDNIKLIRN